MKLSNVPTTKPLLAKGTMVGEMLIKESICTNIMPIPVKRLIDNILYILARAATAYKRSIAKTSILEKTGNIAAYPTGGGIVTIKLIKTGKKLTITTSSDPIINGRRKNCLVDSIKEAVPEIGTGPTVENKPANIWFIPDTIPAFLWEHCKYI